MQINDRVAVITGGGSGIGEALARACVDGGARHVVVADLNGEQAERVADDIGGTAVAIDVADEAAVVDLVNSTENAHGPIDLFCSNAGYIVQGGLEVPSEAINKMWQVHVMAHIYAARAVLPSMIARGEGYLLNTASAAGLLTQLDSLPYSVTKGAAVSTAEWLAIAHKHQGIGVSVLCPQAVRTNIIVNSPDEKLAEAEGFGVAGGDGIVEPAEVATMCLDAIAEQRFWVLPHPEVAEYAKRKADDVDRWLEGMRRFGQRLFAEESLPGDWLVGE